MKCRLYLPLEKPSSSASLETADFPQSALYKSCLNLKLAQLMGFLSQLFFLWIKGSEVDLIYTGCDPQAPIPQPVLYFMVNRSPIFPHITKQPCTVHCSQSPFSQACFCCYQNIYNYLPLHPAFRETQMHALLFQKEKGKPPLQITSSHACVENQMHLCSKLTKINPQLQCWGMKKEWW